MKKFLSILGGCFVVILVVAGVALAIFIPRTLKLDREATSYLKEVVPKIVSPWNSRALMDRATPELAATVKSPDDLEVLLGIFQKLGPLKHLGEPKGVVTSTAYTGSGAATYGNYVVPAEFEGGNASIKVQLRRSGEEWKINGFHVNAKPRPGASSARPISA